jgi:glycosyltransferase involved in cell wall biosynthesis
MRIVIALASAAAHVSGVQRHAMNLAKCLLDCREISAVHLLVAPWQLQFARDAKGFGDPRLHIHAVDTGSSSLVRSLWHFTQLPQFCASLQADIVHLAYPMPIRHDAYFSPVVVSLHDLYPYELPANFGAAKAAFHRFVLRECLDLADAILCVSQSTEHKLHARFPNRYATKAVRIPNCLEAYPAGAASTPVVKLEDSPFLLCVAQHRRNKNIPFALRVFSTLLKQRALPADARFAVIGIAGPETAEIKRCVQALALEERVEMLSGLTEAELQWCYRSCDALIAPSLVEGFGLPVAEALLAGCPVVCSSIDAFREVGGDACKYVEMGEGAERRFADAVIQALSEPRPVPVHLPQFSPATIAQEYLRVYTRLLRSAKIPLSAQFEASAG